jgi:hypothetical protein
MEFFEKEMGVSFVDSATGRRALDIIEEKETPMEQVCGNCEYAAHGDGVLTHTDDVVCVRADSPHAGDFVYANDKGCGGWIVKENNKWGDVFGRTSAPTEASCVAALMEQYQKLAGNPK